MELFLGEVVLYEGRSHTVLGVDPVGAAPQLVYLQELESRDRLAVSTEDLAGRPGTGLRLILGGTFDPRD
jgi:hypothetical protein